MNGETTLIAIYVDDLVVASSSIATINAMADRLRAKYKIKPVGDCTYVLGIKVERDRKLRRITLSQEGYSKAVLTRFGMENCRPVASPCTMEPAIPTKNDPETRVNQFPYAAAIGSIMYLALATRPDLAQAVGAAARHTSNPASVHVTMVKRILRYLKGTLTLGISYHTGVTITGYADADYAGDTEDRRSTSAYIFMMRGGPVSWASRKQNCVTLSTTESEYVALSEAAKEAAWLRSLLEQMGFPLESGLTIMEDNQGAIALAGGVQVKQRTKHIGVRYHFIRGQIQAGDITLKYCPTEDMLADALTKPLGPLAFVRVRDNFMHSLGRSSGSVGDSSTRQLAIAESVDDEAA